MPVPSLTVTGVIPGQPDHGQLTVAIAVDMRTGRGTTAVGMAAIASNGAWIMLKRGPEHARLPSGHAGTVICGLRAVHYALVDRHITDHTAATVLVDGQMVRHFLNQWSGCAAPDARTPAYPAGYTPTGTYQYGPPQLAILKQHLQEHRRRYMFAPADPDNQLSAWADSVARYVLDVHRKEGADQLPTLWAGNRLKAWHTPRTREKTA